MGRVININDEDCMPDGEILDNLQEMIGKGMDIDEILALRYPSFLPHRRVEDYLVSQKERF